VCTFVSTNSPAECKCHHGWVGASCAVQAFSLTLTGCANGCSGNGLCLDGKCVCNVGFKGADCATLICADPSKTGPNCDLPKCPRDCSGNGLCMNGKCACWTGFVGDTCAMPSACSEACHGVCALGESEECTNCIGQCRTLANSAVIGAHNPFDDYANTFLVQQQGLGLGQHTNGNGNGYGNGYGFKQLNAVEAGALA